MKVRTRDTLTDSARVAATAFVVSILGFGCSSRQSTTLVDSLPANDAPHVTDADVNPARLDSLLQLLTAPTPADTVNAFAVPPEGDRPALEPELATELPSKVEPTKPDVDVPVTYNIPIELNVQVLTWVDSYSGNQRRWFARALKRSGRWLPMIERIFREEGVPDDLAYPALVESGYRHDARSTASAIGMWQFLKGTARDYGLRVDGSVDERLDPERATRAAARYLRRLHGSFGDWRLAMAAYNTGEGNLRRAIRRSGSRDFWEICRQRKIARETRNFIPAIMAATILAHEPEKFGFDTVERDRPIDTEWVEVPTPTHVDIMARCAGVPPAVIRSLNPSLIALQTPKGSAYRVRIPVGGSAEFTSALAAIPEAERMLNVKHPVQRGESLSVLAARYGTSIRAIQDANGLGRRTTIRTGTTLVIPTGRTRAATSTLASTTHSVRPGETLSHLAATYGTTVRELQRRNDISNANGIRAGQTLKVPAPRTPKRPENHLVKRGESLWTIARHHGITIAALRRANPDVDGSHIRIGERLRLPNAGSRKEPVVHRVRPGENLWDIARTYQTSIANLREWNGLDAKQSVIHPGDVLKVYR